jgi:hypothetical protein
VRRWPTSPGKAAPIFSPPNGAQIVTDRHTENSPSPPPVRASQNPNFPSLSETGSREPGNDKVRLPFHTKSVVTRSRAGTFRAETSRIFAQLGAIGKGRAIGKHTRAGDAAKVELGDRGSISETRSTHPRTHTRGSTRAAIVAARLTARPCTGKKQHSPLSARERRRGG